MTSINRSFESTGSDGKLRRWPDRGDYADYFVEEGEISTSEHFDHAYGLHGPTFLDWVGRGQTACRFASVLSRRPDDAGWGSIVVSDNVPESELASIVTDLLIEQMERVEIVQLVFPHIKTELDLVGLLNALCRKEAGWYWEEIQGGDEIWALVGLRWILPGSDHVAWTVGFGPFGFLPVTRRSPLTSIVVRVTTTKRSENTLDTNGRMPVHLADMDDLLPSQSARDKLTRATSEAKSIYLNGSSTEAARARVTFKVPRHDLAASEMKS